MQVAKKKGMKVSKKSRGIMKTKSAKSTASSSNAMDTGSSKGTKKESGRMRMRDKKLANKIRRRKGQCFMDTCRCT